MGEAVLELRSVGKRFGDLEILSRVDLTLTAGRSAAVLGPSGAGKSTLLHIAGLMERPSTGSVLLNGRAANGLADVDLARERLDTIGFLFQFHYLLPDFDVIENVMMPARIAGDELAVARRRAEETLTRLGLGERLHHKPYQLSGGEQQRAGLARALMRKPRLLLCDEPTGNLDQQTADSVADLIWGEIHREGVAALIVTHNQRLAARANTIFQLSKGSFVESGREAGV
jgi:lipoprotein-releasing system ATP-binding protein